MIKVELTEFDQKLFLDFQKRYTFIKLMESLGAFDVRSGSITIHFDAIGQIASIDKNQHFRT